MPQKLTTTACFIQDESSGGHGRQFRKHVFDICSVYISLSTLCISQTKLSRLYINFNNVSGIYKLIPFLNLIDPVLQRNFYSFLKINIDGKSKTLS